MSERQSDRLLRDTVHSELAALLEAGGPLHVRPAPITLELGGTFIEDIAVAYRAATPGAPFEGRSAIVTAGPPGAGKSSAANLIDPAVYRRIDADRIKDRILWVLDSQGLLAARHEHTLADGRPVYPAELAWWVHKASTDAADLVRQACLADGENFLMEGTLAWDRLPAEYVIELVDFDYESIKIIDIEVPLSVAQTQARERWWAGRNESNSAVGGRFISDDAITAFYLICGKSAPPFTVEVNSLPG